MPISKRRRNANAANAQKSTGPRTAAGNQAVRYNAVKHGATSPRVLPWESTELFQKRVVGFKNSIHPMSDLEHELFEQLVMSSWQR